MKCPVDGTELVMSDRQGVEIDYCPSCRGVWLDRGELDKIVDRSMPAAGGAPEPRGGHYAEDPRSGTAQHTRKKKRGGFLEEIFDF